MIEWVLIGGAAILGIRKLGKTKNITVPSIPCIIEYDGKYWNGYRFTKDRSEAKSFNNSVLAWEYVDKRFPEHVAEDCGLEYVEQ